LVFATFNKNLLPIKGIEFESEEYELNNESNQIIKTALIKILSFRNLNSKLTGRIKNLMLYFDSISDYVHSMSKMRQDIDSAYSANPFYDTALEYSYKILNDFKLSYDVVSGIQYNSFLENSNDIFEKFCFEILNRELSNNVTKWDNPKEFASFMFEDAKGVKSYIPDIIIDHKNGTARAVFDAKNKHFEFDNSNINDLVSVADIYQLLFYKMQLESSVCGLIYPSNQSHEPIEVSILGDNDKMFLLSINMDLTLKDRIRKLVSDIKKCLIYS